MFSCSLRRFSLRHLLLQHNTNIYCSSTFHSYTSPGHTIVCWSKVVQWRRVKAASVIASVLTGASKRNFFLTNRANPGQAIDFCLNFWRPKTRLVLERHIGKKNWRKINWNGSCLLLIAHMKQPPPKNMTPSGSDLIMLAVLSHLKNKNWFWAWNATSCNNFKASNLI